MIGDGEDHHGQRHAYGAKDHQSATAEAFNSEDGDPGSGEILGSVAGSD